MTAGYRWFRIVGGHRPPLQWRDSLVEWRSYDPRLRQPAPHRNMKRRAKGCIFCGQVSEADVFLQCDGRGTARDVTHFAAVNKDGVVVTGNVFSEHLETDQPASHAFLFLLQQGVAADEVPLFEFYNPAETCFKQ